MKVKGSIIANEIDAEYKKRKEWQERAKRQKENNIMILGEHSRNPLILEKKGKII